VYQKDSHTTIKNLETMQQINFSKLIVLLALLMLIFYCNYGESSIVRYTTVGVLLSTPGVNAEFAAEFVADTILWFQ
jgi:hypothetical protein